MSDYLANLIGRSFAPSEQVRPQIPSMFEPPPVTDLIDRPSNLEFAMDLSVAPSDLPTGAVAKTIAPRLQEEPAPAPVAPRQRTSSARVAADEPIAATESRPPVSPSPHDSPAAPIAARSIESIRKPSQPYDGRPLQHDSELPRAHELFPRPQPTDPMSVRAVVDPAPGPRDMVSRPAPIAGYKESRRSSPAQIDPAPPPSIHVTIGRVEVRAITPPAPVRAKSKKGPELSLDTYLQRRAEGGRR